MKTFDYFCAILIASTLAGGAACAQPLTYSPNPVDCGTACETRTNLGLVTINNTSSDHYYIHLTASGHNGPFCLGNATEWVGLNPAGEFGSSYTEPVYFNGVSCSASGLGTYDGSVTIPYHLHTNDPPVGQLTINCTGEMIGTIELTTTPENYSFGDVQVSITVSHDIAVHNVGEATATVYALDWENNGSGAFSEDEDLPFEVLAGEQRTLTVSFTPPAVGPYNSWLVIRYHDCGGSQATTGAGFSGNGYVPSGADDYPSSGAIRGFGVSSVYPNPFNPSTTIDYELSKDGDARIAVFDVLGREVAALSAEWSAKGRHTVSFDGSSLPAGLYFARLESAGQISTRKLLLLK